MTWVSLTCFGQTTLLRCRLDLGGRGRASLEAGRGVLRDDGGHPLSIDADDVLTADPAGGDRAILDRPAAGKAWAIDLAAGVAVPRAGGVVPLDGVGRRRSGRLAFVADDARPDSAASVVSAGRAAAGAGLPVEGAVRYPAFVFTRDATSPAAGPAPGTGPDAAGGRTAADGRTAGGAAGVATGVSAGGPAGVTSAGVPPVVIDRSGITVRPGFPTHALRITTWCVEPVSGNVIAYDAMSGEIMRLEISGEER